ncbi:hypothetical protein ACIRPP_00365 [Streptomyces sp. NPDC101219]|uniref:hypothetical protein n=1 Tax=Streptomyces sp. NPDC101219 TaxID=3366131 RepID=UPI00381D0664
MLRITDARTGRLVDAAPVRRGLTRVEAHTEGFDATALRVMVVADLLVRALELGGTPVWALLRADRGRPELRAAAAALGVRPFEDDRQADPGLGEARILHVVGEDGTKPDGARVEVAAAVAEGLTVLTATTAPDSTHGPGDPAGTHSTEGLAAPASADPGAPPGTTDPGPDPAALRLALLSHPRDTPVRLDPAAVTGAARTLAHWRRAVADWASRPSRPVPDAVRARLRSAWENDLDAVRVLDVLHDVAHAPDLPDGARFETFAHADRLLGLELTRDLGSPA